MASVAEIRQRVGEELSLVVIGGTLRSQDDTRIASAYNEVYERLKKHGLATWASTGTIPTELVPYLCLMIEERLLTTYSVPEARYNRIKIDAGQDGDTAMLKISELVAPDYLTTESAEDY